MITRLNVDLRRLIASRFLAVMFAKAKEALLRAEHELAHDVFGHFMSQTHQAILNTIPDEWLPESNGIDVIVERVGAHSRMYLDYGIPRRVPAFLAEEVVQVKDKQLAKRVRAHAKKRAKHDAKFHETKSILLAFLGTMPNTKRLVDAWPVIKSVVDEVESEMKARAANQPSASWGKDKRVNTAFTPGRVPEQLRRVKLTGQK